MLLPTIYPFYRQLDAVGKILALGYFHLEFLALFGELPRPESVSPSLSLGVEPKAASTLINNNYLSC